MFRNYAKPENHRQEHAALLLIAAVVGLCGLAGLVFLIGLVLPPPLMRPGVSLLPFLLCVLALSSIPLVALYISLALIRRFLRATGAR